MFDFKDKVVVVTGSTQGIGRVIAEVFARAGAAVVVTGRNQDKGRVVEEAIRAEGGEATYIRADLSNESDVEALFTQTLSTYQKLDVLINNAAPIDATSELIGISVKDTPTESFDKIIRVGLYGTFWCCKCALKAMEKNESGGIINITSAAATRSLPGSSVYSAMKSAIEGLTRGIAVDGAPYNIRCNAVCLGFVDNGEVMGAMREGNPAAVISMEQASMLNRLGKATEVGTIAMMLASEATGFVTGAVWDVDGGLKAKMPMSF